MLPFPSSRKIRSGSSLHCLPKTYLPQHQISMSSMVFGRYLTLDYSGLEDRTLLFTPKSAQRVDRIDPPIRGKKTDRVLAIDYQLLQQASPPGATTEQPASRMERVAEPLREPLPGTSASEAPSPTTEVLAQDVEALRKELHSVQKQLDSQTTTQDSPERNTTPPSKPQQIAP